MNTDYIKKLFQKVTTSSASEEEKLRALRELNTLIEEYNKVLKGALMQNPA